MRDHPTPVRMAIIKKTKNKLSLLAHVCNLNHMGGQDWEDGGSRAAQKKVCKIPSQGKKN
jgi:hypothetical protein